MSVKKLPDGVWPTVITLFNEDGRIDYAAMEWLIEWYVDHGVAGLFAICMSSEMFALSREERRDLLAFVIKAVDGRLPVVASGHVSDDAADQAAELNDMVACGIDSLVLVSNRFAEPVEAEGEWRRRFDDLIGRIDSDVALGLYECPYPYKTLLTDDMMRHCLDTGRFNFLKDTSCRIDILERRQAMVEGTSAKVYNANASYLYESLKLGGAGYCGVMANFHPDVYAWLCSSMSHREASYVGDLLGILSCAEARAYPVGAKYHLSAFNTSIHLTTRTRSPDDLTESFRNEIRQMERVVDELRGRLRSA